MAEKVTTTTHAFSRTKKVRKRKLSESEESYTKYQESTPSRESDNSVIQNTQSKFKRDTSTSLSSDTDSHRSESVRVTSLSPLSDNNGQRSWLTRTTSSSPDDYFESTPLHIYSCTSEWNDNLLKKLNIAALRTQGFSPKQLVSEAIIVNDPNFQRRIDTCKERILRCAPLKALDVEDLNDIDVNGAFGLLLENTNDCWYHNFDAWDIAPIKIEDKVVNRLCRQFCVSGEKFARKLIMFKSKIESELSESGYQSLFQDFVGLFGLSSFGVPDLSGSKLKVRGKDVSSVPDIIFPHLSKPSQGDMNVIALCKVKRAFKMEKQRSPEQTRQSAEKQQFMITHLEDSLIGQFGGELLVHFPLSQNQNGLLGLIIQGTHVTFSHFQCTNMQFEGIKHGYVDPHNCPVLLFSKPYNYLKASDRQELIEPFLTLALIQCTPHT